MFEPQEEDLIEQLDLRKDYNHRGLTYSNGVIDTIKWVLGMVEEPPIKDLKSLQQNKLKIKD